MNKTILRNIHLINWYGFSNRTIPVSENLTLISGENECGKSTILDAIKYAYTGDTQFNKAKGEGDTQTIGLLICKTKDNILAKYAVETSTEPIGISEYELNALMPKDFKGTLPTIEELEQGLSEDTVS